MYTFTSLRKTITNNITITIFSTNRLQTPKALKHLFFFKKKKEVQVLQAFVFPVVTVNDKHAKSRLKKSIGVILKEGICAKL